MSPALSDRRAMNLADCLTVDILLLFRPGYNQATLFFLFFFFSFFVVRTCLSLTYRQKGKPLLCTIDTVLRLLCR